MKAVISSTYDDMYLFFLPIVVWSWKKIDVEGICAFPAPKTGSLPRKLVLGLKYLRPLGFKYYTYHSPEEKEATYAQCSRLYAAAIDLPEDEILITGDIDMAVFNQEYFEKANNDFINVFGTDLVPPNQFPICYISMPVKRWREVMGITAGDHPQKYLDQLLGHLECEHFKGNYWAKDQETIYGAIANAGANIIAHNRAKYPHQFATRRADRDGWPDAPPADIIDAHLPRPGYTDANFAKILKLFQDVYPHEDFTWMIEYRNEYVKLINNENN